MYLPKDVQQIGWGFFCYRILKSVYQIQMALNDHLNFYYRSDQSHFKVFSLRVLAQGIYEYYMYTLSFMLHSNELSLHCNTYICITVFCSYIKQCMSLQMSCVVVNNVISLLRRLYRLAIILIVCINNHHDLFRLFPQRTCVYLQVR